MRITFLGTGAAWCIPEHTCDCKICEKLGQLKEQRTRTCLFVATRDEKILVDCGPDIRSQLIQSNVSRPDVVLITHEHGDHFLGLDDLLAYRRSVPKESWMPIPVCATEQTWSGIEPRFGYLIGSLITKKIVVPGEAIQGLRTRVIPFKTFHGPTAAGSVGYIIHGQSKMVYTSDFMSIENEPQILKNADILVMQSHWFNEPDYNRPFHMSFQRSLEYIQRWNPRLTCFVHISDGDWVPDDKANSYLKKLEPKSPLTNLQNIPYRIPLCQSDWEEISKTVWKDYRLPGGVMVPHDGLTLDLI